MSAQRIQLRRTAGWRKPEGVVVVTRPGRWGNPYRAGWCCAVGCGLELPAKHWHVWFGGERLAFVVADQGQAVLGVVSLFARALEADLLPVSVADVRRELAGRDLACWCPLEAPCHGDVLLAVANGGAW